MPPSQIDRSGTGRSAIGRSVRSSAAAPDLRRFRHCRRFYSSPKNKPNWFGNSIYPSSMEKWFNLDHTPSTGERRFGALFSVAFVELLASSSRSAARMTLMALVRMALVRMTLVRMALVWIALVRIVWLAACCQTVPVNDVHASLPSSPAVLLITVTTSSYSFEA